MATPLTADLHSLLIRPRNSSIVLGAAHHALYRPLNYLSNKTIGKNIHTALDPETWGEKINQVGESADFVLSAGRTRKENIDLENSHILDMHNHVQEMKRYRPEYGHQLERNLNSVIATHYNNNETLNSLATKALNNKEFAATLHGVAVPSLSGEEGRIAKNFAADVASMYGASQLMSEFSPGSDNKEKRSNHMTEMQKAKNLLEKAAAILASIPVKERAYKQASQLLEAGAISDSEVEKYASAFERNPEDAPTIVEGMLRGVDRESKMANLGYPVYDESPRGQRFGSFEQACLQGLR